MHDALTVLAKNQNKPGPSHYLLGQVAALSVGIVAGAVVVDLDYVNDSKAEVDMNVVMRRSVDGSRSDFIEVQGTGEQGVFSRQQMDALLDGAAAGISELHQAQRAALGI